MIGAAAADQYVQDRLWVGAGWVIATAIVIYLVWDYKRKQQERRSDLGSYRRHMEARRRQTLYWPEPPMPVWVQTEPDGTIVTEPESAEVFDWADDPDELRAWADEESARRLAEVQKREAEYKRAFKAGQQAPPPNRGPSPR